VDTLASPSYWIIIDFVIFLGKIKDSIVGSVWNCYVESI